MEGNGTHPDLPTAIAHLPGPRRVDRLRKALREGEVRPESVAERLENWLALYRRDAQPALRVLVLEVLDGQADERVDALLRDAVEDRGDSVRLEALRQLLTRHPDRQREIALRRLEDEAMEVRVLAAQAVHHSDHERALDALFAAVLDEARGPREMHTLRWVLEYLAEEVRDRSAVDRIRALREECDDTEGMIDWALDILAPEPEDRP